MSNDDPPQDNRPANDEEGWARYYEATRGRPPRPLLVRAVEMFGRTGDALDLGFGAGNEVLYLRERGFRVTAVDADAGAVRALEAVPCSTVRVVQSTFDEFTFEPDSYDLVSAHYALPFNPPATFNAMFARLRRSIRPAGLFCGVLWGERDAWNTPDSGATFHRREDALQLFEGMELAVFEEHDEEVELACRGSKHGHWYEIIARQPERTRDA